MMTASRHHPLALPVGWILLALLGGIFGLADASADSSPVDLNSNALSAIKREIEIHYFSYDVPPLRNLLTAVDQLRDNDKHSWYPLYYGGLIHVLIGNIVRAEDKEAAYDHFHAAVELFEKAQRENASPELRILTAMAYGKLASLETIKMIYYGSKAKSHMHSAFENRPQDPKLYLVAAVHLMFTPEVFGGSKDKSKELLEKALKLNQMPLDRDPLSVNWALDPEIFAYMAQLEILKDDRSLAMHYAREALRRKPHYGFVHRDILPHIYGEPMKATFYHTQPYRQVGAR